jgi:uncharacterized membrane protein
MVDQLIGATLDFLQEIFVFKQIVVTLIAILPIVEARLAIPIAFGYNLDYFQSWIFSYLGSTLIAPILLLVLIPFIKWLSKTKLFKKIGSVLYEKFENKAKSAVGDEDLSQNEDGDKKLTKSDWKKALGVFIFVAIPLPLTGVWTGCAVASILKLKYPVALGSVALGNLVASGIILLLSIFFQPYIDYIILALAIIAVVVVAILIIKIITHKVQTQNSNE